MSRRPGAAPPLHEMVEDAAAGPQPDAVAHAGTPRGDTEAAAQRPGHLLFDGHVLPFEPGDTLIRAAQRAGLAVPHLCWHPDYAPVASCRLCTVLVDGRPATACSTLAAAGQRVECQTAALADERHTLLQMLFVEGNHFCPSCEKSGHCRLQGAAREAGMLAPGFDEFYPARAVDASHPEVWLDHNRCILCGLCVRASHEADGKDVFAFGGHGIATRLVVNSPSGRLGDSALAADDRAAQVCPVGAILPKRRGFAVAIGQRPQDLADAQEGGT